MKDYTEKTITGSQVTLIIIGILLVATALLAGCPGYSVWQQGMKGQAEFKRAEYNRKVKVLESEATLAAAKNLADTEIARAKGVAEANHIIGESLKGNEAYLHYLWIHNIAEAKGDVIYVPTEANLPVLEANRFQKR